MTSISLGGCKKLTLETDARQLYKRPGMLRQATFQPVSAELSQVTSSIETSWMASIHGSLIAINKPCKRKRNPN